MAQTEKHGAIADLDTRLNRALRTGHAPSLVALYIEAAGQANSDRQRGFFLTHAYVHALEAGDPRSESLREALVLMGREV